MPVARGREGRQRAVELYKEGRLTTDEIAVEVGAARSTVYTWLNAAGLTGKQPGTQEELINAIRRELDETRDLLLRILDNQESFKGDIRQNTADLNRLTGVIETLVMIQGRPGEK
jgi:transposase-like protein